MPKTLSDRLYNMSAESAKQFTKRREKLLRLDASIEEKLNQDTVVYRPVGCNIFAESDLQTDRIRIQIRNRKYNDSEGWVKVVPPTHRWTLDHYIFVEADSSLDYALGLLSQSLNDVLPLK